VKLQIREQLTPKPEKVLELWLEKSGGVIHLKATSEAGTGHYYLLKFTPDGKVHFQPSIPEEFGLNLDKWGQLVIETDNEGYAT
jgi:hypothetical protein